MSDEVREVGVGKNEEQSSDAASAIDKSSNGLHLLGGRALVRRLNKPVLCSGEKLGD